mmetsp:Transcript_4923/g.11077  ORF Transcript_4923/g.11077 Transcript_4923/m.11077 type:complete len:255 (+) Transcript_4923:1281-2045(+)
MTPVTFLTKQRRSWKAKRSPWMKPKRTQSSFLLGGWRHQIRQLEISTFTTLRLTRHHGRALLRKGVRMRRPATINKRRMQIQQRKFQRPKLRLAPRNDQQTHLFRVNPFHLLRSHRKSVKAMMDCLTDGPRPQTQRLAKFIITANPLRKSRGSSRLVIPLRKFRKRLKRRLRRKSKDRHQSTMGQARTNHHSNPSQQAPRKRVNSRMTGRRQQILHRERSTTTIQSLMRPSGSALSRKLHLCQLLLLHRQHCSP